MTVQQVIEGLSQFDGTREVRTEGCDCLGDIGYIVEQEGVIYIARPYPTAVLDIPGREYEWEDE